MNIQISPNWKIRSDSLNIMLVETLNGHEFIRGFFATLQGLFQSLANIQIKRSTATTLQQLRDDLKMLRTRLNTLLQPYNLAVVEVSK